MTTGRPKSRILGMAEWVEGLHVSLGRWLLLLGAIVVLRHFLEQASTQSKTLYFLSYFIHYPLAYIAPLLALSVVLSVLAREHVERVTRLMLFAWLLTLLPPLVDIVVHRGTEAPELIGYLIPHGSSLGAAFLNLLNPAYKSFQGTTTGIRVEAGLGCILGAFYVFLKTRNAARTALAFVAVYVTMFFFFALPSISLTIVRLFGAEVENVYLFLFAKASVHRAFVNATPFAVSDLSNALIDLIVIAPLLAVWYRLYDANRFRALIGRIDPVQTGLHLAATLGGAAIGARLLFGSTGLFSVTHPFDVIALIGIAAASIFTALTAGGLRAIHERTDGTAEETAELRTQTVFCFSFACLFAVSVSYVSLTYVLAALAAWYLYYARPFRLERFPLLSGFTAGAAILFTFSLGFSAYAGASASLWMPGSITALCLFIPTLAFLARDVWSPTTDRWSLASMLPGDRDRTAAGAAVFVASLLPGAFLAMPSLLVPGAVVGVGAFFLIARGRRERVPVGLAGLAAVLVLAGCLMGACGAPILREQLALRGFEEVGRKSGMFSLSQDAGDGMQQGLSLFESGDYEEAAEAFRTALEKDPENVDAYLSIGSAYLRLERLSEAARSFRKAIDLAPDNPRGHLGLGQTYQLYGDFESAFGELTKALEIDKDDPEVVYALAVFFQKTGDTEQEAAALERMLELDPERAAAYTRLADIYIASKMYEDATRTLTDAIAAGAEVAQVHTRLAEAYYRSGDLAAAESELRTQIDLNPHLASPHAILSRILSETGRTEEARSEIRTAMSLTNDPKLRSAFEKQLESLGE